MIEDKNSRSPIHPSYNGIFSNHNNKNKSNPIKTPIIDDFQFLNAAVNKMKFGIKEIRKRCSSCGEEVRTDMQFPGGASAIFVVHDAFDKFIKK